MNAGLCFISYCLHTSLTTRVILGMSTGLRFIKQNWRPARATNSAAALGHPAFHYHFGSIFGGIDVTSSTLIFSVQFLQHHYSNSHSVLKRWSLLLQEKTKIWRQIHLKCWWAQKLHSELPALADVFLCGGLWLGCYCARHAHVCL